VIGLVIGMVIGIVAGIVAGIATEIAALGTSGPPARPGRIGRPRLRRVFTRRSLKSGLVAGLLVGLAGGFAVGLLSGFVYGLRHGIAVGLVSGFVYGLAASLTGVLAVGLANAFEDPDNTSSLSPAISWRNDRRHAMAIGLLVGLLVGLVVWLVVWLVYGLVSRLVSRLVSAIVVGIASGIASGIAAGLMAGLGISHSWPAALAAAQLARRWHTPLHLMNFLDDARERNVLHTVGPVYQFRHARLQDRLAAAAANGRTDQPLERQAKCDT
jgi:hypothetical protein